MSNWREMAVESLREYWIDGDGFERAVKFVHKLKQTPSELRALIFAARLMRGGDGGRDTSKWWRGVPVTLGVPRGERRGRMFTVSTGGVVLGIATFGPTFTSCTAFANEMHGEIEAR